MSQSLISSIFHLFCLPFLFIAFILGSQTHRIKHKSLAISEYFNVIRSSRAHTQPNLNEKFQSIKSILYSLNVVEILLPTTRTTTTTTTTTAMALNGQMRCIRVKKRQTKNTNRLKRRGAWQIYVYFHPMK